MTDDYKNIKLFIATPCYGNTITVPYMRSLLEFMKVCRSKNITYMHYTLSTESLVTRARNSCVAAFLAQKVFTHFLFIDADISFEPLSILKLIKSDKDIVGGVYPKKNSILKEYLSILTIKIANKNHWNMLLL
jgi:hypothetical protein